MNGANGTENREFIALVAMGYIQYDHIDADGDITWRLTPSGQDFMRKRIAAYLIEHPELGITVPRVMHLPPSAPSARPAAHRPRKPANIVGRVIGVLLLMALMAALL